jgi:hypothetical protein
MYRLLSINDHDINKSSEEIIFRLATPKINNELVKCAAAGGLLIPCCSDLTCNKSYQGNLILLAFVN